MLKQAVTVAYNRGRFELAQEILSRCTLAETLNVDALRDFLRELDQDPNSITLDGLVDPPDYVMAKASKAFDPTTPRPLRSVPNGN